VIAYARSRSVMSAATKTASLDTTIETFFQTKTASDVAGYVAFFAPDLVSYIDATLGSQFDGYDALKGVFEQYMPNWSPPARSYATGVTTRALSSARPIRRSSSAAS
jgi:ketosteroid isomerase-like protein